MSKTHPQYNEVLQKMMRYCAFQERCHQEVRTKLSSFNISRDIMDEIIYELIQNNYLNEERFAIQYAGSKYRVKAWGKNKILYELQQRDISDYCINKALNAIEDDEYSESLEKIIRERLNANSHLELILAKDKTMKYCAGKGYEMDLILSILRKF